MSPKESRPCSADSIGMVKFIYSRVRRRWRSGFRFKVHLGGILPAVRAGLTYSNERRHGQRSKQPIPCVTVAPLGSGLGIALRICSLASGTPFKRRARPLAFARPAVVTRLRRLARRKDRRLRILA